MMRRKATGHSLGNDEQAQGGLDVRCDGHRPSLLRNIHHVPRSLHTRHLLQGASPLRLTVISRAQSTL